MKHSIAKRIFCAGFAVLMANSALISVAALDPDTLYPFDASGGFEIVGSMTNSVDGEGYIPLSDYDGDGIYELDIDGEEQWEGFDFQVRAKNSPNSIWGKADTQSDQTYSGEPFWMDIETYQNLHISFDTTGVDYNYWPVTVTKTTKESFIEDGFTIVGAMTDWDEDESMRMTDPDGDGIYEGTFISTAYGDTEFYVQRSGDPDHMWGQMDEQSGNYMYGENFRIERDAAKTYHVYIDTNNPDAAKWETYYTSGYDTDSYFRKGFGLYGTATSWVDGEDIKMTDEDSDGIYTGSFYCDYNSETAFSIGLYNDHSVFWGMEFNNDLMREETKMYGGNYLLLPQVGDKIDVSFDTRDPDPEKWSISYTSTFDRNYFLKAGFEVYGNFDGVSDTTYAMTDDDGDGVYEAVIKHPGYGEHSFRIRRCDMDYMFWGQRDADSNYTYQNSDVVFANEREDEKLHIYFDTTGSDYYKWPITCEAEPRDEVDLFYDGVYLLDKENNFGQEQEYRTELYDEDEDGIYEAYINPAEAGTYEYLITLGNSDMFSYRLDYIWGAADQNGSCFGKDKSKLSYTTKYREGAYIKFDTRNSDYRQWKAWIEPQRDPQSFEKTDASFAVCGDFTGWQNDIMLTDPDGDGIYTAYVNSTRRGGKYYEVRTAGDWANVWSEADSNGITYNSNSGYLSIVFDGEHTYRVSFDTTNPDYHYWTVISEQVADDDETAPNKISDFIYEKINNDTEISITGYNLNNSRQTMIIPDYIDGLPVTVIGEYVFNGGTFTSVQLPSKLKYIYYSAFNGCENLGSIVLPKSLLNVQSEAFAYCSSLNTVIVKNQLTIFGTDLFYNEMLENGSVNIYCDPDSDAYRYATQANSSEESAERFNIYALMNNTSAVSADVISSGDPVVIRGQSQGGTENKTYQFFYKLKNANQWIKVENSNISDNNATIVLNDIGTYAVKVIATDENGISAQKVLIFDVVEKLTVDVSLSAQTVAPGQKVTIKATATGGTGTYTYEIYGKKSTDSSWKKIGTGSTAAYTPETAGTYVIRVYVKDGKSKAAVKDLYLTAAESLTNNTTVSKLNFAVGESVTVKGAATGGTAPYTYEFYYKRSTVSTWTKFGKDGVGTFKPGSAGTFTIKTYVKDKTGKASVKEFTLTATAALTNNTTVSKLYFTVGETVTVKGAATGGTAPYTYEFYYKRSTVNNWTRFDKNGSGTFKPGSAGTFTIKTYVKDSTGKASVKEFTLTATAAATALTNNTTVTKTDFNVGEAITVKGAATGGTAPYTYEFYYKRSTVSTWTKFGKDGVGAFQPGSAGTFTIKTYVKDSTGKASVKEFTLTATTALTNNTTVTKTDFNVGEAITVKGAAVGGTAPYTYEFYYKRSTVSTWTKFGKDGVGTFQPGSAGTFTIKTYVKDSTGKASVKEFTLTAK